jgi:hypothetical protein
MSEAPELLSRSSPDDLWPDSDAADLESSWVCHPDFAMARAFNPEIRLRRDQTFMQGAAHCATTAGS